MIRQQQYLINALDHIDAISSETDADGNIDTKLAAAYGGLCHKIPMLVLADGLAQTVAWIEEKASGYDRADASPLTRAYARQRDHISDLFGIEPAQISQQPSPLVKKIQVATNTEYMRYTMMLLDAWIYYKRFAVSILGVDESSAQQATEGTNA